jgi:hypothetical protein
VAEIRYLLKDASREDIIRAGNTALGILKGDVPGHFRLYADDGIERNIRGGATISTGKFALEIQSAAGDHLDIKDSAGLASRLRVTDARVSMSVNNFEIIGTVPRITSDLSNATHANRLMFQTYIVNGASTLGILPNGSGAAAGFNAYGSSDPAASAIGQFSVIAGSDVRISSTHIGAAFLPLGLYTSNTLQVSIATTGVATFTAAPIVPLLDPPSQNGQVTASSLVKAFALVTGASGAMGHNQNIASVTRNSAGNYTVAWDRDFTTSTYAILVSVEDNAVFLDIKCNSKTASSADIFVADAAGTPTDPDFFSVAAFGVLA